MSRKLVRFVVACLVAPTWSGIQGAEPGKPGGAPAPKGRVFYVRQTLGDDANDGLSPETAWRGISKLSAALQAGDTAYVGPGLYREDIQIGVDGTAERPITLVADATGEHTGDPPGIVMVTGAEPVDESIFEAGAKPGVYKADFPQYIVGGVVEMDGPQYRFYRARSTKEHLVDGLSELDVVSKLPSTYFYDEEGKVLYLHTTDGKPPLTHEIELFRRSDGVVVNAKHFVIVVGFTFRHMGDAGIRFFTGAGDGIAIGNTSYGCRQGIRVYGSTNILAYGNTLFRNENSGIYLAKESVNGHVIANTLYENVKGARWSSGSTNGLAAGNVAFDNSEAGISVESTENVRLVGNRLVNNKRAQLLAIETRPLADGNCLESRGAGQLLAELSFFDKYDTLAPYQRAALRDHGSRQGGCGPLPEKLDVRKLHEESTGYAEKARKILAQAQQGHAKGVDDRSKAAGNPGDDDDE